MTSVIRDGDSRRGMRIVGGKEMKYFDVSDKLVGFVKSVYCIAAGEFFVMIIGKGVEFLAVAAFF